ncbi:hypothetical protein [Arthrobacter sp. NPDC057013]|uniref:hypothetical protein n=1 Tax=Arthrobacter sp. NPDC057013 TaxID=3345999 RepID=UPI0036427399
MTATIEPDILDLFAGPGGWDRGAELAGINPRRIIGVELDATAVQTARAAGYTRLHGNVLELDPADFPSVKGSDRQRPVPNFLSLGQTHRPLR